MNRLHLAGLSLLASALLGACGPQPPDNAVQASEETVAADARREALLEQGVRVRVLDAEGAPVEEVEFEWRGSGGSLHIQEARSFSHLGEGRFAVWPYVGSRDSHGELRLVATGAEGALAVSDPIGATPSEGELVLEFPPVAWLNLHAPGGAAMTAAGEVRTESSPMGQVEVYRGIWPCFTLTSLDSPIELQREIALADAVNWPADDRWLLEGLAPGDYRFEMTWTVQATRASGGSKGAVWEDVLVRELHLEAGANELTVPLPEVTSLELDASNCSIRPHAILLPLTVDESPRPLSFAGNFDAEGLFRIPVLPRGRYLLLNGAPPRLLDVPTEATSVEELPLAGDAYFVNVDPGGDLAGRGVREGDRLVELDGQPMTALATYMAFWTQLYADPQATPCTVERGDEELELVLDPSRWDERPAGGFVDFHPADGS